MRAALRESSKPDIFHLHGTWLRAMQYGADEARRRRVPYLVELMGMYEPYGLALKPWRKRVARRWFQDAVLREANCLHVNSRSEGEQIRELGFRNPLAIIPVGVDIDAIKREWPGVCPVSAPQISDQRYVLFLSRIQEKKGIETLLRSWADLRHQLDDHLLVIAGTGEPDYVRHCRELANTLGLAGKCVWLGGVSEPEKVWIYAHASLFVLPSVSENYGNAVAEALACGTPVLTTTATPWGEIETQGCGWIAKPAGEAIRNGLLSALRLPSDRRREMGRRGQIWCEQALSLNSALHAMEETYEWLVNGGSKPGCVI